MMCYNINQIANCTKWLVLLISILQLPTGCRKFVQVDTPPDRITQENVFSTDRSAISVLTGIYISMNRSGVDMAEYGGLLSDEFSIYSGASIDLTAYYTNSMFATSPEINSGKELWQSFYQYIFKCNAAIEGIINNNNLTDFVKNQLLGEAYFLRAWLYFYLVNLYGDLPLAVSSDPEVNRLLSRSTVQDVYELIVNDLLKAQNLLASNYVNGQLKPYANNISAERVRPSSWAARALLARAYLYTGQWAKAETEATKLIANIDLFALVPLEEVFLKNSREAIWQLQPVTIGLNTPEGSVFNLSASPAGLSPNKPVYLSEFLLDAFELNDQRRILWIDSLVDGINIYHFPFKYKIGKENPDVTSPALLTEYSMMLRLSEQYLIRAEARARQNNLSDAILDLDTLRSRVGLPKIAITNPGIGQEALLNAILHERQTELFTEWGHRWFDIKRFGKVDEIMSFVTPVKGGSWETTDKLLPIPFRELQYNPNLSQNSGY